LFSTAPYLACLHDQNKSGFFEESFIQPNKAIKKVSISSEWLEKSRSTKKAPFVLIM